MVSTVLVMEIATVLTVVELLVSKTLFVLGVRVLSLLVLQLVDFLDKD